MPSQGVPQLIRSLTRRPRAARPRASFRFAPSREDLENRTVLTLTSSVTAGVLTVTSTFDDPITISASSGGNVLINGADPGSGQAPASSITQVQIQGGPGANAIDVTAIAPSVFTALTGIAVNGGGGEDVFDVNPLIPGTYDGAGAAVRQNIAGVATNVSFDCGTGVLNVDGVTITLADSTGPVFDLLQTQTFSATLAPGANATVTDGSAPGDGISAIRLANSPKTLNFLNPAQSLTVGASTGSSSIAFNGLDPVGRPADVTIDAGTTGATTVAFTGTAVNATFDVPSRTFIIDGLPVKLPHQAAVAKNQLRTQNFTINPPPGGREFITPGADGNDGFSQITDLTTGRIYSFPNPSNSLTVNASGTVTFAGLDPVGRPANTTFNGLTPDSVFGLGGTANSFELNLGGHTAIIDGYPFSFPNYRVVLSELNALAGTVFVWPGSNATVSDSATPGDGLSEIADPATGRQVLFRNPVDALTIASDRAHSLTYAGLDPLGRPAHVTVDAGPTHTDLILVGAANNVAFDYASGTYTKDGETLSFINTGNLFDRVQAAHLTFVGSANTPEVVSDDGASGDGVSVIAAPTLGLFTTFVNPTASLTVRSTGGSPLTYTGLDRLGQPASVTFLGSGGPDVLSVALPGRYQNVVYGPGSQISYDGSMVTYGNFLGVHDTTVAANRTFLLASPSTSALSASQVPNTGVSRLTALPQGTYTDFENPSDTLNIVGGPGNDTLSFYGLDPVGAPRVIGFNGAGGRNTFVVGGPAPFSRFRIRRARIVHPPRRALHR